MTFVRDRRLPESDGPSTPVAPGLSAGIGNYQDVVMRLSNIDPVTTELVRLRCARQHQCFT
ncbi:MAG: hypothetical protein CL897_00420 [Dehalococcoidia bacterium]|nr:hypothetical protein [Dehalococcoidia bacterium]